MTATIQFAIKGMTCASCANRIEKALLSVAGVTNASVNLATETATVTGDARYSDIKSAVSSAGYQLDTRERLFAVKGMTCASCAGRVEKSLLKVAGVLSASVNLATEQVTLVVTPATSDESLAQAVSAAGYELVIEKTNADTAEKKAQLAFYQQDSWPVWGAAILTLPLVLPMVGMLFGSDWMLPPLWQ
ncbi:MAG TPA: copper ion binding protein, partial [Rheinheimera sp.]|nr:copper ion binding protein [Rheinheimera sp.]